MTYIDIDDVVPAGSGIPGSSYRANGQRTGERLPLFPAMPSACAYPVDCLGPMLSRAAKAIAAKVQVPAAIASQSVLAAASLAAQAHADVVLPYGQKRPLSLNFASVQESGGRKTTADREALWPIRKREEVLHEIYVSERQAWAIAAASWAAEKRAIEANKKLDYEGRREALRDLGPEPESPLHPFLVAADPTIEGLIKAWANAPASLGLFSAEGGQFVGGHGMTAENRLRTAAGFSECWDGATIKRVRAADGVSILRGRRLAAHIMLQPEAAATFLTDPVLKDQGLLSRFLVASPDTLAGSRRYAEPRAEDDAAIRVYGARILALLETPWPISTDRSQGLDPRALPLSADATNLWRDFYDGVEVKCGAGRDYAGIRDLAAKAAEHVARIAGVLTIVENINAPEVRAVEMEDAIVLVAWYLGEAVRLQEGSRTDPVLLRAQALLNWLQLQPGSEISFREILRLGPNATRIKKDADQAIEVLSAHGWVEETSKRPRTIRLLGAEVGHA
ncbi:uncharacterized protein DUF3987 [Enterovirga rhinocerotis]|uniref:Uncharacterized protein DUF3987 n=2 Tax=Enterovirga rhinocerotis TaxID=1339210 RepID=A0A4R7CAC3_9HYPH|nr:uncharacterized protein DUF3987 [Enterovirga rhinocerotis]